MATMSPEDLRQLMAAMTQGISAAMTQSTNAMTQGISSAMTQAMTSIIQETNDA